VAGEEVGQADKGILARFVAVVRYLAQQLLQRFGRGVSRRGSSTRLGSMLPARALRVRLRLLTALPVLSSVTLWFGRLMARAVKLVFVSFLARGSFLPTLCLTFLKSTPTPGFFFLGSLPPMLAAAGQAIDGLPVCDGRGARSLMAAWPNAR
jgi:hypothetical protein